MDRKSHWRTLATLSVMLTAVMISSCGPDAKSTLYPVRGSAFFRGKPATGAILSFHRVGDNDKSNLPHAKVQSDGSFTVTSHGKDDGVSPGTYLVTVIWKKKKPGGSDEDTEWLLPTRYLSGDTSGISVEIKNGPTELEPIQLTK